MRGHVFSSLTDIAGGGSIQVGTNYVPGRRRIMTHLIVLLVALTFALGAGTTPAWAQAPTPPAAKKAPVDINSASATELKAVTGIGEADAKKIVENRPYKSTDELVQKKVMPKATYDKIKDQIVAK
jgi:competence protein ComEA